MNLDLLPWIDPVPPAAGGGAHHAVHAAQPQAQRGAFHRGGGGRVHSEPHLRQAERLGPGAASLPSPGWRRRSAGGLRPALRPAEPADAARRHRRRQRDSHLLLGLHERGPRLPALFRLLEPVHLLDARHRAGQQLPPALHLLGTGRRVQLPAHRLLVRAAGGGGRGQEGLHHQPPGGLRVPARHPDGLGDLRLAELRRDREGTWLPTRRPSARWRRPPAC